MFRHVKKLHFVGIGGIGMSGIAELLLNQGFKITGSDIKFFISIIRLELFFKSDPNPLTDSLVFGRL